MSSSDVSQDRPNLFILSDTISPCLPRTSPRTDQIFSYSLILFHHVFPAGRRLGLVPFTSITVQCLIHSVPSLHSTCPNHLNIIVPFLITKLTGSTPKSSHHMKHQTVNIYYNNTFFKTTIKVINIKILDKVI